MTGDGERRLRTGAVSGEMTHKQKAKPCGAVRAVSLLLVLTLLIPTPLDTLFQPIGHAFAAGKDKKDKAKDKDTGNGASNGNGGANGGENGGGNGNGNGNGGGNGGGNGNGNGLSNGITNGNGLGIDLGDGVGMGIGVGDENTVGVGIGISVGEGSGRGHRSLEADTRHKDTPRSRGFDGNDWSPGNGRDKRKNSGADELDLGEQFDARKIGKAFGSDLDELGKLLDPGAADKHDVDLGALRGAAGDKATKDDADKERAAKGEADPAVEAAKANSKDDTNSDSKALAKVKDHDDAVAKDKGSKDKDKENNKDKDKDKEKKAKKEKKEKKEKTKGKNASETEAAAAGASPDDGSPTSIAPIGAASYVEREVLALGLSPAGMTRARQLGFSLNETGLEQDEKTLVTLYAPARLDALQAIALLRREMPREAFHLNRIYRPYNTAIKDDLEGPGTDGGCRGDKCYGKSAIGWKDEFADCARDVKVGVIDTDIDLQHPTFSGQKITRKAFLADGKQPSQNWHGTGVLALLAGRPDSDTPGLIPAANFFVANVFFADGSGETITDTVSLLKSLEWMNVSQARVVNMSFSGPQDDLVQVRLKAMRARGFVFTAAAGNEGPAALPSYPAAYPEVIAVTAVTKDKRIYPSANRGPYIDLAAPGVRIWTAMPEVRKGYRTGTSFATPFATAVVALQRPDLMYAPKDELLDHVNTVKLGSEGRDPIYGRGLLQAPGECSGANASVSTLPQPTNAIAR